MVTYGFYNSINHDRVYDATQMSEIFDGIIRDGVYQYVGNKFLVDKNGLDGFQVRVSTGRAWFNHTWTKNDAPLILTLPAPPTLDNYYRADAIVIDINANVNVRENKITYVTGTEVADNPSPPYPELLDGEHKQVALAYIVRKGAETEINAANINYVVGSSPCPYVTAPVQAVDLSAHVAQWQAAWEQWFQGPNGYVQTQARAFEAEIAEAEAAIENATDDVTEEVAEFRIWIASQKSQFNGWMDDSKNDFDSWFANLQYILDGDVAGHLQNEIEVLQNEIVPIEKGGTGNDVGYIRTGNVCGSIYPIGGYSTTEGFGTIASGKASHAEGGSTVDEYEITGGELSKTNSTIIKTPIDGTWRSGNSYLLWDEPVNHVDRRINPAIDSYWLGISIERNNEKIFTNVYALGSDNILSKYYAGQLESKPAYNDTYTDSIDGVDYDDNPIIIYEDDYIRLRWATNNYVDNVGYTPFYLRRVYNGSSLNTYTCFYGYGLIYMDIKADHNNTYKYDFWIDSSESVSMTPIEKKPIVHYPVKAIGDYSHAEGFRTIANEYASHAEGADTSATGYASHAEGYYTIAKGESSHAEGSESKAIGTNSHAGASGTAYLASQFVHGCFGFGGNPIYINSDTTYEQTALGFDETYLNGALFSLGTCSLTIETNRKLSGPDGLIRCFIVFLSSSDSIEIDIIQITDNSSGAPVKHEIIRDGNNLANFPSIEAGVNNGTGYIKIPVSSINNRRCQIVRII